MAIREYSFAYSTLPKASDKPTDTKSNPVRIPNNAFTPDALGRTDSGPRPYPVPADGRRATRRDRLAVAANQTPGYCQVS